MLCSICERILPEGDTEGICEVCKKHEYKSLVKAIMETLEIELAHGINFYVPIWVALDVNKLEKYDTLIDMLKDIRNMPMSYKYALKDEIELFLESLPEAYGWKKDHTRKENTTP